MLPPSEPDRIRIAFDDHRLVSNAGLILPVTLAQRLGLRELVGNHVDLGDAPGRANTGDKMMTLVASALAGGDCIDDADEWASYRGLPRHHEAVAHGAGEYVRNMAHTNGLESHWALFKRGIDGTYHHISVKHLPRYSNEFEGRHNRRPMDTAEQMGMLARSADGKRLRYEDLVA